ncbi:AAA family ATPase, partial [uncultured Clostridium sp.]|uniref:AAA family ATPase n=1 Tax=uncultured Clostridium sp. TaxID=59620 RepID=UPI00258E2B89
MNKINYINFENIKSFGSGNESFKLKFQNCDANSFNIIVAPNGSGKSSLATALQGVAHGTIKLDSQDLYKSDFEPRVTIKLDGIYNGIYISDKSKSEISKHMDIFVINSSLNARKVNHYASGSVFSTADLAIDGIKLYENIPEKCVLNYKYQIICKLYRLKRNYLINLSNIFLLPDLRYRLLHSGRRAGHH